MFYLSTIEQLFLFVEQLDQIEVCLPLSRLLTGIPILAVFQNLRWNSNNTSLQGLVKFKNFAKRIHFHDTYFLISVPLHFIFTQWNEQGDAACL